LEYVVAMKKTLFKLSIYNKPAPCDAGFGTFLWVRLGNRRVIFLALVCYGSLGGIVKDVSIWGVKSLIYLIVMILGIIHYYWLW
jgi:hypothetical protein